MKRLIVKLDTEVTEVSEGMVDLPEAGHIAFIQYPQEDPTFDLGSCLVNLLAYVAKNQGEKMREIGQIAIVSEKEGEMILIDDPFRVFNEQLAVFEKTFEFSEEQKKLQTEKPEEDYHKPIPF